MSVAEADMIEIPIRALPYISTAKAQNNVTHNEAIRALDIFGQLAVFDYDSPVPPPSPANGDRYLVLQLTSDEWASYELEIAPFQEGA